VNAEQLFQEVLALLGRGEYRLDDTPFQAYGLDSMRLIRLAGAIEERFGIEVTDSEAFAATSFARLVALLERKLAVPHG
jgi:acyl carrier protein